MLAKQKTQLAELIRSALQKLSDELGKPSSEFDRAAIELSLEKPRQAGHGDVACNIALRLAKPLGIVPRELATQLSARLGQTPAGAALIEKIEVAGPGFLNFTLTRQARAEVLFSIAVHPERFGYSDENSATGEALIEFVSANPTGPLHVGHGRQAALGDTLASLLSAVGIRVKREFYYNDAGAQIQNLALSVQARAKGLSPEDPAFPADGYKGDYIADIAHAYAQKATVQAFDGAPAVSTGDLEDLEAIRRFAVAYLRHEQDLDLRAFGVDFDRYYLESSLYADGKVQAAIDALVSSGHAYESEGALWLRTTTFGDDKDRVMRKSDGSFTYFVPDVAYHVTKWQRGFSKAINIQGSDHHGTVARVRAGLQALNMGIPAGYPDYVLHKMVTVMRGGQEVKISKRAGSYVTLRDLISWSGEIKNEEGQAVACDEIRGRDAVRFFLVSRKADTEFVFDVDLALSKSEDNPVYYVQYAHARICSVLLQAGVSSDACLAAAAQGQDRALAERLDAPKERLLLNRLAEFPGVVQACADELSPHLMAFYLRELAGDFHSFYNSERVLVDESELRQARLLLLAASGSVLRSGLSLLGVSAPTQM